MDSTAKHRLKVTVNGNPYLVEVDDLFTSPVTVKVNGQPYQVDVETAAVEQVSATRPAAPVALVARATPVLEKSPRLTKPGGATGREVKAPMPGNIVDINVEPGDQVSVGQELCSLEAMKMKNAIRSPRAGVIASVTVTLGQAVAHGDVLCTFE